MAEKTAEKDLGVTMMSIDKLSLNRDNFLDVLGYAKVRAKLSERAKIDHLYNELVIFIRDQVDEISLYTNKHSIRDIDFKIPGTPIHFNLSGFLKDKIEAFISVYLILEGALEGNYIKIGSGMIISFINKFNMLHKEYGELCLVESLSEIETRNKEKICLNLYGRDCRYPNANCQFNNVESNICLFGLEAIEKTLEALENKNIIKKVNAVEPVAWKIEI